MAKKTKAADLSIEEKLEQALVVPGYEPYKIPDNWCWVRMNSISNFERGITFPASAKEKEKSFANIPCLRTANVQETLDISDLIYVDKTYMKNNPAKLVKKKDILMSIANSKELVGKTSLINSFTGSMTFGGFVMAIRSKIVADYLFYYLRNEFYSGRFIGDSTQTTNIANINSTMLGQIETPVPPLAEQQRIVERIESLFAKLDEAKEKAQEVIDSFEARKAAILHKAFTGELTAKWREENGVGIDSWENCSLIDVLIEKPRNGYSPKPVDYPTSVKSMTLSATTSGTFMPQHFKYIDESIADDSYLWLKNGDILIQRANSLDKVGTSAIYTGGHREFIYPDLMMKLQIISDVSTFFIAYQLKTQRIIQYFRNNATGTTGNMPKINQKVVSMAPIVKPSIEEQNEIVRILDDIFDKENKEKEAAETVIDQIDTMKKAILSRAFRGELGTNDPEEGSAVELLKQILSGE